MDIPEQRKTRCELHESIFKDGSVLGAFPIAFAMVPGFTQLTYAHFS